MQMLKFAVGCGCLSLGFVMALLLGNIPFRFVADFPLAICAVWITTVGLFLICRSRTPLAPASKIYFLISFITPFVFLIAFALPNFIRARSMSCCNGCMNNLRQIDAAANQFALEQNKKTGEAIHFPDDLTPYIKLNSAGKIPPCPDGGVYSITKVGQTPICSLGTTVIPAHVLP